MISREDSEGSQKIFRGEHFYHTTLWLVSHFDGVTFKLYKQNMWVGFAWWTLLIGQSGSFQRGRKSGSSRKSCVVKLGAEGNYGCQFNSVCMLASNSTVIMHGSLKALWSLHN